jgi:hypothetical protein
MPAVLAVPLICGARTDAFWNVAMYATLVSATAPRYVISARRRADSSLTRGC